MLQDVPEEASKGVSARNKNGDYGDFRGKSAAKGSDGVEYEEEKSLQLKKIYPYGVGQNRLRQAARTLRVPVAIVDGRSEVDFHLRQSVDRRKVVFRKLDVPGKFPDEQHCRDLESLGRAPLVHRTFAGKILRFDWNEHK